MWMIWMALMAACFATSAAAEFKMVKPSGWQEGMQAPGFHPVAQLKSSNTIIQLKCADEIFGTDDAINVQVLIVLGEQDAEVFAGLMQGGATKYVYQTLVMSNELQGGLALTSGNGGVLVDVANGRTGIETTAPFKAGEYAARFETLATPGSHEWNWFAGTGPVAARSHPLMPNSSLLTFEMPVDQRPFDHVFEGSFELAGGAESMAATLKFCQEN